MDKEQKAIERIKQASEMSLHSYKKPLICTYSGGKDSDVILELFKRSGIPFEVHNSHTTVDAPNTVYHIRKKFYELELKGIKCTASPPPIMAGKRMTMWNLIPHKKLPPTRIARYCCAVLKEGDCKNRMIATGVRWEESRSRSRRGIMENISNSGKGDDNRIVLMNDNDDKRKLVEKCEIHAKTVVNPIIDWGHYDIWDFINSENIEVCDLYFEGFKRIGCIGCPMAGKNRWFEFRLFPSYQKAYISAFERMLQSGNKYKWKTGEEVFRWWMEDKNVHGQLELQDFMEY